MGGTSAALLASPASIGFHSSIMGKIHEKSDSGSNMGTIKKFMRDSNIRPTFSKNRFESPNYNFHTHTVGGARSLKGTVNNDVLLHELGHAKDFSTFKKLKIVDAHMHRGLGTIGYGLGTFGALHNEKTRDYAPVIAAIPGISTLRSEGAANYHAYHAIKAHKGAAAANKFLKKVVPTQMGGYAVGAAIPVAGAVIAKNILNKWESQLQKRNKKN